MRTAVVAVCFSCAPGSQIRSYRGCWSNKAGMDVNAEDTKGCYPIENALFLGNVDMMRELLRSGADLALIVSDPEKDTLDTCIQTSLAPGAMTILVDAMLDLGLPVHCEVARRSALRSSPETQNLGAVLAARYLSVRAPLP